jgi:hypothetical protein
MDPVLTQVVMMMEEPQVMNLKLQEVVSLILTPMTLNQFLYLKVQMQQHFMVQEQGTE